MTDWFTPPLLTLDALAVFRVTRLVTEDTVPFGPIRSWIERRWPDSLLDEWTHCPWCVSMPVAAVVLTVHALTPGWWPWAAAVLAFSSVTGLLATAAK